MHLRSRQKDVRCEAHGGLNAGKSPIFHWTAKLSNSPD